MTFKHLGEYYMVVCQYEKMRECLDKCDNVNSVLGGTQLTCIYKKSIDTHFVEAK